MRPYPEEPSCFWALRRRPCEPWENALSLISLKTSACQVSKFYTGQPCVWRITDFPRVSNSPHTGPDPSLTEQRCSGFSRDAEDRPYRGDTDPRRAPSSIRPALGFEQAQVFRGQMSIGDKLIIAGVVSVPVVFAVFFGALAVVGDTDYRQDSLFPF